MDAQHTLPQEARAILQKAADTPNTSAEPRARLKAIERAIEEVKFRFPAYFKPEEWME